jgi:hypothetical protein
MNIQEESKSKKLKLPVKNGCEAKSPSGSFFSSLRRRKSRIFLLP